ncbi:hypothetical protein ERJ75_001093600 [Trypanosoma vivax]|nr:hypothetical protein ERJ75_001093600 [Trypanosoma vivax]
MVARTRRGLPFRRGFGCVGACEALAAAAHGMAGMACAFFFLAFSWLATLLCQRRFCEDGHDTDAGLLRVVSGALKGGARQAQVDTARAFTLMTAIAAHRAGPDVAKGAQPALAKMSARTKQEAVAASQRATHALASLERQKARAAALAQAIATSAAEAATLSAHIAGEMDQWARIASTLASKATSGFPCITTNPSSNSGTITVTRNLVAATEPQSGSGTANGKPVPAECDADPTAEMQAMAWSHVTSEIDQARGGSGILKKFTISSPTSGSQDSCPLTSVAAAGSAGSYRDWRMAGVFNVTFSTNLIGTPFSKNIERVTELAKQLNTLTQEPEDQTRSGPSRQCLARHADSEPNTVDQQTPSNWRDACTWCGANLCSQKQSGKIQRALAKLSLLAADSSATSETQSEPQAGAQRQSDGNAEQDQGTREATALGGHRARKATRSSAHAQTRTHRQQARLRAQRTAQHWQHWPH